MGCAPDVDTIVTGLKNAPPPSTVVNRARTAPAGHPLTHRGAQGVPMDGNAAPPLFGRLGKPLSIGTPSTFGVVRHPLRTFRSAQRRGAGLRAR